MNGIRLPNITSTTEKGQLEQVKSYLIQLAQQLNWALGNIDTQAEEAAKRVEATKEQANAVALAQATFSEVKSLIIKSADIVNAYYEEISRRLDGLYVAESDFGTYKQETSAILDANSERVNLLFSNQQTIQTDMESLGEDIDGVSEDMANINGAIRTDSEGTTILGSEAWVKIGVLDYEQSGFPIYGMEIGQVNTQNGEQESKRFAQYRSDGVHLYDQNGIEVATIANYKLRITNAEMINAVITNSLTLGGYAVSTDNGLTFKWKGVG